MNASPQLGNRHALEVLKLSHNGLLLDGGAAGQVLLPSRELAGTDLSPGDSVSVTLYQDGRGRVLASLRQPRLVSGQVALLPVVSTSKIGAFLDWGMPKDLLLPFAEQTGPVRDGQRVLVIMTQDREGRLLASAKLDRFLKDQCDAYSQGDAVSLVVSHQTDLGCKVVVDHRYWGMIADNELRAPLKRGQILTGYVQRLRRDGKLSLSLNPPGEVGREALAERILAAVEDAGGSLALGDKSSPQAIFEAFRCSKNAFKQALGGLYKAGRIKVSSQQISLPDAP